MTKMMSDHLSGHPFRMYSVKRFIIVVLISLVLLPCAFAEIFSVSDSLFADTVRIKNDLTAITKTKLSRSFKNTEILNLVADYIYGEFLKNCDSVGFQTYFVDGVAYKNVIGSIGVGKPQRIVVGAHYDVCGDQQGADDNASGVVGVIELSRLLSKQKLKYRIDFVAYSLEEPPYFRTEHMGSNIHAKMLYKNQENVKGMICLEMIGYFNDTPKSQSYPLGIMSLFYGNKGNYITVVQKFGNGKFGRQVKRIMKSHNLIRTKSFRAPAKLPGVDFSDHRNYWKYGYSAVMITNTAFFRNPNYHKPSDTMETLDLKRMAQVINEVYLTLLHLK